MICQSCQQNIPEGSRFCPYCQTELYNICSYCGTKYPKNFKFCNECGAAANRNENQGADDKINPQCIDVGGFPTQARTIIRDRDEMICNTPEYIEAHIYINNIIKKRRRSLSRFWLFLLLPAAISLFGCIFLEIDEGIVTGFQGVAALLAIICLIIIPLSISFIARSGSKREKFINKYMMKHDIDPQIATLVSASLSKMRTLGNMSHRRILKRIPTILKNSYKYIHNFD